jgi:hypothetical protein
MEHLISGCRGRTFCRVCAMKLNQMNPLTGTDPGKDQLLRLANRMKALRLQAGHLNYEKFALDNGIARAQYRSYELGANITYTSLLRVMKALNVTPSQFFSEGLDIQE